MKNIYNFIGSSPTKRILKVYNYFIPSVEKYTKSRCCAVRSTSHLLFVLGLCTKAKPHTKYGKHTAAEHSQ